MGEGCLRYGNKCFSRSSSSSQVNRLELWVYNANTTEDCTFSQNTPRYELPLCCDIMGLSNSITVPDWPSGVEFREY